MPNQHERPAVFSDHGSAGPVVPAGADQPDGHQPLQSAGDTYHHQRTLYLEAETKRLYSENDLLRTAMQTLALEGNRLMAFYLAFKTWQDNGCPLGDKTHDALFDGYAVMHALDEKAKARTSAENVSDVLDAVVRLMRSNGNA